jgi:DNA-binding IclR family transcriptional regulator
MPQTPDDPLFVSSLDKAMRVLAAFRHGPGDLSLSELAAATGLNKSAVQRFAHTFVELGYLTRDPRTRRLSTGVRLLDLAYAHLVRDRLAELAMPHLIALSRRLGRRVNLVEPDGPDIVYTVRLPAEHQSYSGLLIGRRLPMYCTSGGIAILSCLPEAEARAQVLAADRHPIGPRTLTNPDAIMARIEQARRDQVVIVVEGILKGEIAVSSPIRGPGGRAVGAVQVSAGFPAYDEARVRADLAPFALETARALTSEIPGTALGTGRAGA